MIYGYCRVSSQDQNCNLQLDALKKAGCEQIFVEHGVSGAKVSRPELDRMLSVIQPQDTIIVWKMDRLGRSMAHLASLVERFKNQKIKLISITEGFDISNVMGRAMCALLAIAAEIERENLIERTRSGIASAKQRGKKWNSWKVKPEGVPVSRSTRYRRQQAL